MTVTSLLLPRRRRGRASAASESAYQDQLVAFCGAILEIRSRTGSLPLDICAIDLRSLFGNTCAEFNVPIANAKGWSDLNMRAAMMRRFKLWEGEGKQPVLLYCGDFDPGGLQISNWLRSNMEDLAGVVGWSPDRLIINRFGLNYDYIEAHRLVWIDNLITGSGADLGDPKHPDHRKSYVQEYIRQYGRRKVEANALLADPEAARELCRNVILQYVDLESILRFESVVAEKREAVAVAVAMLLSEASP